LQTAHGDHGLIRVAGAGLLAQDGAMVFASINGIPGIGFAELSSHDDACEHRGKIRLNAANAHRLRRLIEERAALVYYGPVWIEERWQLRSFQLDGADIQSLREDFFVVQFAVRDAAPKNVVLTFKTTSPG
jgi:hypothetical protein